MVWLDPDFITRHDLGIAYRKAKADLFYENDIKSLALCTFESKLDNNLEALHERLHLETLEWMTTPEFCGEWSVIPKRIDVDSKDKLKWQPSDPDKIWNARVEAAAERPIAELRVVGIHSIEFHVISALWMMKVGSLYDSALGPEAYGSRLRRLHRPDFETGFVKPNPRSIGSFKPWLDPYRRWQDDGLKSIRLAVEAEKSVVAVTADVRQFYHRLSPEFLLDQRFLQALEIENEVNEDMTTLTRALVDAINAWCGMTPIHRERPTVGIPVGLSASRLIANVALAEMDRVIRRELSPIYYGRYVDDLLLVFEDNQGFSNVEDVWSHIAERTRLLRWEPTSLGGDLRFSPEYLSQSEILFSGSKQKVFLLNGKSGLNLIETIEHQVRSRTSEWRALPDIPTDEDALSADILCALGEDAEEVDSLRRADSLSARKSAFALRLRDVEAFEQDLPIDAWKVQRRVFLEAVRDNLIALPQLFTFAPYLPRIFSLAISCRDYDHAISLVHRLIMVVAMIERDCDITLAADDTQGQIGNELLTKWRDKLTLSMWEGLVAALKPEHASDSAALERVLLKLDQLGSCPFIQATVTLEWSKIFFGHDLGRTPFRVSYFPNENVDLWKDDKASSLPTESADSEYLDRDISDGVTSFLTFLTNKRWRKRIPLALLFPTRPFTVQELYLLTPRALLSEFKQKISQWVLAFRGFFPTGELPGADSEDHILTIPLNRPARRIRIAVTSWHTELASWQASVARLPDPDLRRYARLNRLLNDVMRTSQRPDYLILPELSIRPRWFLRFSKKFAQRDVSLIAGVEYIHHGVKQVANQVWGSFVSDFLGVPSPVVYRQDKSHAALHEESELWNTAGLRLTSLSLDEWKPILQHGAFLFGILVCSELTNIEYRHALRGKVDAVFVPEWNQDFDTFSTLVESSALDVHAYIVQCNDRQFGDSRIRAPMKQSWERDILRVKGGLQDYFVVGEIDPPALRRFQSTHRSKAEGPFKPVPDGFQIAVSRKGIL